MTIREAIKYYMEEKAKAFKMSYEYVVNCEPLCITIPLMNGTKILFESHPDTAYPNMPIVRPENGIYKYLSFKIIDKKAANIIPSSIEAYTPKFDDHIIQYYNVKEEVVDEFIHDNGGIDIPGFKKNVDVVSEICRKG